MTKETKNYYTTPNNRLHIPTREEFHRFASNEITEGDFCTNYPPKYSGTQINKVASSINWTYSNERNRNNNQRTR